MNRYKLFLVQQGRHVSQLKLIMMNGQFYWGREIINVQPMNGPMGQCFYLNFYHFTPSSLNIATMPICDDTAVGDQTLSRMNLPGLSTDVPL